MRGIAIGPSVVFGALEQARSRFLVEETTINRFVETTSLISRDARSVLAKLGLGADHVVRKAELLSPGERTRASLALLQARRMNGLVLDEPTNHLGSLAIEQLESALDFFPGTVLFESHDRQLLQRFSATRTSNVDKGQLVEE